VRERKIKRERRMNEKEGKMKRKKKRKKGTVVYLKACCQGLHHASHSGYPLLRWRLWTNAQNTLSKQYF
jgi:hypothetical protein